MGCGARGAGHGLRGPGATLFSLLVQANAVTAGFVYLISVMALTVWRGLVAGTVGSIVATATFNYFFFPPIIGVRLAD